MNRHPQKILLVEDDEDDYLFVREMLSKGLPSEVDLHWAPTYEAALEVVTRNSYDICLLDYHLGQHNGLELMEEMVRRAIKIPVILLTGEEDEELDIRAMRLGVVDYLIKAGVTSSRLERSIRYATEHSRAEKALHSSEQYLNVIFEHASDAYFFNDLEGYFVDANKAAQEIIGFDKTQLIGANIQSMFYLLSPEQIAQVVRALNRSRRGEPTGPTEYLLTQTDGRKVAVEVRNYPVRVRGQALILTIVRDITEQKEAETARKEQLSFMQTLLDSIPHPMFHMDNELFFQGCNRAFENYIGLDRSEIVGAIADDILPVDPASKECRIDASLLGNDEIQTCEVSFPHVDGATRHVLLSKKAYSDSSGIRTGLVGIMVDLTEYKENEARLRRAQKTQVTEALAGGIAYNINEVLSVIIGYTEIMLDQVTASDYSIRSHLEQVLKASLRAQDLVLQMLMFAHLRKEQDRLPTDIESVIRDLMERLRTSIPETIETRLEIRTDKALCLADSAQIQQMLLELCTNAVYAMRDKGGVLEVILEDVELGREAALLHRDLKKGPHLKLTVNDTGSGIDPAARERIFDLYFTTKGGGESSGLGLSIVYEIVKSHEGALVAGSQLEVGSSFQVYLPRIDHELSKSCGSG